MKELAAEVRGEGLRIGIVRSRFNEAIGRASLEACATRLTELGARRATKRSRARVRRTG